MLSCFSKNQMFFSSLTILIVYITSCGTSQVIPLNIDTNSSRLEKMRNSFLRVALKGWNSLPSRIRKISKHTFQNTLKDILLEILGIVLIINKLTFYHSTYLLRRSLNNTLTLDTAGHTIFLRMRGPSLLDQFSSFCGWELLVVLKISATLVVSLYRLCIEFSCHLYKFNFYFLYFIDYFVLGFVSVRKQTAV